MLKKNNIIIWGGKSQSRIAIEIIKLNKKNKIIAIVDPKINKLEISNLIPFVKTENDFKKYLKNLIILLSELVVVTDWQGR